MSVDCLSWYTELNEKKDKMKNIENDFVFLCRLKKMGFTPYQLFLAGLMLITGSINTLSTKWADR